MERILHESRLWREAWVARKGQQPASRVADAEFMGAMDRLYGNYHPEAKRERVNREMDELDRWKQRMNSRAGTRRGYVGGLE